VENEQLKVEEYENFFEEVANEIGLVSATVEVLYRAAQEYPDNPEAVGVLMLAVHRKYVQLDSQE
jgi:hypothetical protein